MNLFETGGQTVHYPGPAFSTDSGSDCPADTSDLADCSGGEALNLAGGGERGQPSPDCSCESDLPSSPPKVTRKSFCYPFLLLT